MEMRPMNATALTTTDVTRAPRMRPTKTEDGVNTGFWITLEESVAIKNDDGAILDIPAGTLLTAVISSGMDWRLGCRYESRGTREGFFVHYRKPTKEPR